MDRRLDYPGKMPNKPLADRRPRGIDYSELHFKMDRYMIDGDDSTMSEYYRLVNSERVKDLAEFIKENSDEEVLMRYMPKGGTIYGFARYIISKESNSTIQENEKYMQKHVENFEDFLNKKSKKKY